MQAAIYRRNDPTLCFCPDSPGLLQFHSCRLAKISNLPAPLRCELDRQSNDQFTQYTARFTQKSTAIYWSTALPN